jgi:hypothetical protein
MSDGHRIHRRGLPRRGKGRLSTEAQLAYERLLAEFCETIRQIRSTLDFEVSSRGWCYILEEYIGLVKGDFDEAQQLINDCRKAGLLPIGICAQDGARTADNLEDLDDDDADEQARSWSGRSGTRISTIRLSASGGTRTSTSRWVSRRST